MLLRAEARPFLSLPPPLCASCRADQILRFRRELAFLVSTGRHADTALWYQRVAAAAAAAATQEETGGTAGVGGGAGWAANASQGPEEGQQEAAGQGGGRSGELGAEGGPGFLAEALEGSSNSSRLDAKLAVSERGYVWGCCWRFKATTRTQCFAAECTGTHAWC